MIRTGSGLAAAASLLLFAPTAPAQPQPQPQGHFQLQPLRDPALLPMVHRLAQHSAAELDAGYRFIEANGMYGRRGPEALLHYNRAETAFLEIETRNGAGRRVSPDVETIPPGEPPSLTLYLMRVRNCVRQAGPLRCRA